MTSLLVGFGLGIFGALVVGFIGAPRSGPPSASASAARRPFTTLSLPVALVRDRFGPRLLSTVDAVAGTGLLGFACLPGWRTVGDS